MKITIFGCELTGLVTAGALASTGNEVLAVSVGIVNPESLKQGIVPREEPGLLELIQTQVESGRLKYTDDWQAGLEHGEVVFLSMPSWWSDKTEEVIALIGQTVDKPILIVNQVTLPVGTADRFEQQLQADFRRRDIDCPVRVVVMPEFISEGSAIANFTRPDRIVIGAHDPEAIETLKDLMRPFNRMTDQIKVMSTRSAEYTKYAVNAVLATRISLLNELANNAEKLNADIEEVRQGVGSDHRIGFSYLYPGCGFGGQSFASDVQALVHSLKAHGSEADLLETALEMNEAQKEVMFRKAWRFFQADLTGKKVAIWGLAFKPNTDTIVNAPSLKTVEAFVAQGAEVYAHDPKANANFAQWWGNRPSVHLEADLYAPLEEADALVILTEWKHFWNPDFERMKAMMRQPVIFDGRNLYEPKRMQEKGFRYFGVGRGEKI